LVGAADLLELLTERVPLEFFLFGRAGFSDGESWGAAGVLGYSCSLTPLVQT
jgi:hypothetical protein